MNLPGDMRDAAEKARSAIAVMVDVAEAFERRVESENARIARRNERLDAREERILALCDRLETMAKHATAEVEEQGVADEYRLRGYGTSNGLRLAIRLIREMCR